MLSPININTILPGQAILLAMLVPEKLGLDRARQVLAQRPVEGYGSIPAFWAQLGVTDAGSAGDQLKGKTRWFEVSLRADLGGDEVEETVLFDAESQTGSKKVRLVRRQWGESES